MPFERFYILWHDAGEGPGLFDVILKEQGISTVHIKLYEGESLPTKTREVDSLLLMGGPMNVYAEEQYPFLKDEERLIRRCLQRGTPILGVCLGAQLIAKAAGAKVWKGPIKELGWGNVLLSTEGKAEPLFQGFPSRFPVFHWHGDTFDLPSGGVPLARNENYLQAFRLGGAYALQFHLEVTEEMIKDWLCEYDEEVRSLRELVDPEQVLRETASNIQGLNNLARNFMEGWLKEAGGSAQTI